MNNETFGITFQYAICLKYKLENYISIERVDDDLLDLFISSNIISEIFTGREPIQYLSDSKEFTSSFIKRCPHNFLLANDETFSVRTFQASGKMFAPKVVGQAGDETFNHFFGHLTTEDISRKNFKEFCLKHIDEMLPIIVDYALVSDYNCWLYFKDKTFHYEILKRDDLPELTFDYKNFTFTKPTAAEWVESNTIKYKGKTVVELQLHTNRAGYKIRLHRENFPSLLKVEKKINNSLLGDTVELAICNVFELDSGINNDRLLNNSDKIILKAFEEHYTINKPNLFPLKPVKYSGTEKRERGGHSKSGVDFFLENNATLSVKTNKSKAFKVCPPEVGQPSPKTFDLHFSKKGWYEGKMNEEKFRLLVKDKEKLSLLLSEYVKYLNECDYLLWSLYLNENNVSSKLVVKSDLENILFNPNLIDYSNDFTKKSSVTIKYGKSSFSLGEFQVHSARNSLKFRFNFNNLLAINEES
ncbi:hypothetical protein [Flavobacterium sp. K5-23]|uniref:hypothetical protein n=1 Tax=Flavobacterium sp. K5-23 TaxID=2746225 RepID=UPI002010B910|nr:hypothetical protein [Flavobacterium sp. K5-23]UQD55391.1 hypothetical protein FLAK523_02875 [Flavobacterium sp. K5-23]